MTLSEKLEAIANLDVTPSIEQTLRKAAQEVRELEKKNLLLEEKIKFLKNDDGQH
jgi:hypothetical protein